MTKICFLSYEIHPTVKGGCGVLLHHSAALLLTQGHEVIFLLDIDSKSFQQFDKVDRLQLPHAENCRAYQLSSLIQDIKSPLNSYKTFFEYKARQFYLAARKVYNLEKPNFIEFFEYCGIAYYALNAKVAGLDFADSHLTVRLHNSLELIDRQQPGNIHGLDRYIMYGLERHSLRFAETVLFPSRSYLEKEYLENYEPWFGNKVHSQPAILNYPTSDYVGKNPDGVLFYGRLFGPKGVDRFLDAAILYLSDLQNPRRSFYLVGYDSNLPPTGKGSYREYLISKIPYQFREFFIFLGQLSWIELGNLLPKIMFAVVPSYSESFCYAAHELYEAGVPLIVSDIPAFEDSFQHNLNALVFDGSVSDLAEKIRILSKDETLRRKFSRPYPVARQPLGDFYGKPAPESWIKREELQNCGNLLICILVDDSKNLDQTINSINVSNYHNLEIVLMYPEATGRSVANNRSGASMWFLGKLYWPSDRKGAALNPTDIYTKDALLILESGDVLDRKFISHGLGILKRQSQLAFVGSWQRIRSWRGYRLETLPLDAVLEIAPFIQSSPFSRFIMRTSSGKLLIDLFESRAGRSGELSFLWDLNTRETGGLIIPEALVTRSGKPESILDQASLDFLILRDKNPDRKARLARYMLSLDRRKSVLRRNYSEIELTSPLQDQIIKAIQSLATSRLSKWMDRIPWMKNAIRFVIDKIVTPITGFRRN